MERFSTMLRSTISDWYKKIFTKLTFFAFHTYSCFCDSFCALTYHNMFISLIYVLDFTCRVIYLPLLSWVSSFSVNDYVKEKHITYVRFTRDRPCYCWIRENNWELFLERRKQLDRCTSISIFDTPSVPFHSIVPIVFLHGN
jgi:hypothetical protein